MEWFRRQQPLSIVRTARLACAVWTTSGSPVRRRPTDQSCIAVQPLLCIAWMIRGTVTRVVLIDPHPVYRLGLEHVCASDAHVEVVGAVSTGVAGLRAIKALEPDVAVSEFDLPDQRGPALVEACRDAPISTPVMILTARRDGRDVYEALGAGASGYVLKSAEADFIRSAIESVASGETVIDLELHQSVAAEIRLNATC